jgi:ParB family chromosome partitioning protein
MHRQSWRNPSSSDTRWLRFLASCRYSLAKIKQQIIDAADERGIGTTHNADPAINCDN